MWFFKYVTGRTDKQTERHIDTLITILFTPTGNEMIARATV